MILDDYRHQEAAPHGPVSASTRNSIRTIASTTTSSSTPDVLERETGDSGGRHYSPKVVRERASEYFKGDDLAATTWMNKYALRDERAPGGSLARDMHRRMAREFARIEAKYVPVSGGSSMLSSYGQEREQLDEERIFCLLDGFRDIVPQGSVIASLGIPTGWPR